MTAWRVEEWLAGEWWPVTGLGRLGESEADAWAARLMCKGRLVRVRPVETRSAIAAARKAVT